MMKIKIIQYFIGNNQKYLKLCKKDEELNRKYCQLCGYDFDFIYFNAEEIKQEGIDFLFYKIKFIYDYLIQKQNYDYYVFLDADAVVSNPNIKIEDLIDDKHQLFLSRGNDRFGQILALRRVYEAIIKKLSTGKQLLTCKIEDICNLGRDINDICEHISLNIAFNEGFFIIKNDELMKDFFEDTLKIANYRKENALRPMKGGLQGRSMAMTLQMKKYNSCYTFMYDQAQGGVANSYELNYDIDKTFILHNFGQALNLDQKINQVQNLKTNKWWKPILEKEN